MLLVLQAAGLGGIGAYSVYRVDWRAAFGLLLMFRMGWLLAMIVQSLTLLACLLLYAEWEEILSAEPLFIYPVMLYCIVMVLYLNSSDVRAAFHVKRRREAGRVARGL